nr:major facilitator superfamily domain-containing protein 10-like [Cherax quadricarinatus]
MQAVMFISLILDLLGFTVILPLFPALLDYYSKNDSSGLYSSLLSWVNTFQHFIGMPSRFHSVLFGGLLGSLFSLLQFLASPITGALSDVYGRKPVFICTLIGVAASYGVWAVSANFTMFVLARIIGGATKGNVSLAYSVMTDISDEKSRAKGMALIGVAFSIGFTIGPAVGAMFSRWGSTGWFAASALYALTLAFCNIIYFYIFFKETLPETKRRASVASGLSQAWELINPRSLFSFSPVKGLEKEGREYSSCPKNHDCMALKQGGYVRACQKRHEKARQTRNPLGIWRSLGALARAIGPIVTSIGFWSMGAEMCYIIGGLSMLAPLIMLQSC